MAECEECGKKLGMLEGYRHPTMGKKHHLCSPCFDQVSESVRQWGEFVRANAFNVNASKSTSQFNLEKITPKFPQIPQIFDNFGAEKGISTER